MTNSAAQPIKAPGHLRRETRVWWLSVVTGWSLEPHHVRLLTLAAEAWDRCTAARQLIAKEGLTVRTQDGGCRAHPGVRIEADSRTAFCRCLRELDLDIIEPPKESAKRPPALRSMAGG